MVLRQYARKCAYNPAVPPPILSLTVGTRLGAYEVVALIGAGGMGEVYRARDTRLKREVAIKILPDAFANDPERLARFQREAEVLATLNHPNIAQIHGVEERALVLELVEGPTLGDRIAQGPIPLDEALPVAKQIVEALGAAHERSIIHRDLKPANIKLTPEGKVKILDFGLAKALDRTDEGRNFSSAGAGSPGQDPAYVLSQSPTLTSPLMTGGGIILGTAAYMSPEQAKGKTVDKRTDVWAFGCVLFEMLNGRRAFEGEDVSDTMAAILRAEPDWKLLPAAIPEHVRLLLARCLDKDRTRRIANFEVVDFLLNDLLRSPESPPPPVSHVPPPAPWKRSAAMVAVGIAAAALGATSVWRLTPTVRTVVTRFAYQLPDDQQFTNTGRRAVAISTDGIHIAYVANQRLYLKSLWDADARVIAGTALDAVTTPTFSPDGNNLVFWASSDDTLKRISTDGGTAITLCPATNPVGLAWDGDTVIFGQLGRGILRVAANGGTPEVIVPPKKGEVLGVGEMLPDSRTLLYIAGTGAESDLETTGEVVVQAIGSSERKTLLKATYAQYLPTGHILYFSNGVIFAVRFDVKRLEIVGSPVPVIEGVRRGGAIAAGGAGGAPHFAVSANGTIVYIPGAVSLDNNRRLDLAWLDQKGAVERFKFPPRGYDFPRLSPDGRQLAVGIEEGGGADIWVYDIAKSDNIRRLTFGGKNRFPLWSADSRRIAFQSDREGDAGIFWQLSDGSGIAERLTKAEKDMAHVPQDLSMDGRTLLVAVQEREVQRLWTMALADRKMSAFGQVQSTMPTPVNAAISPDGRWIAYASNESQRDMVYVQPFPASGARYEIGAGRNPFWARDGQTLYFSPGPITSFSAVSVTTKPGFSFSPPRSIPRPAAQLRQTMPRNYDIARDGSRFVIVINADDVATGTNSLRLVLNWFEELKQRVPSN